MRAGLMIPPQTPLDRLVPLACRAEELGYEVVPALTEASGPTPARLETEPRC
ncbi:MAG: hypothetical protein ACRDQA_28865 [Nocardioidaceae bacterium]